MCTFFVMTVLSLILETYEWDTLKDYAKKYENDRDSGTRSLISGINRNYFEPYVMELVFEFTVNANTMIERQIRRMGSIQDDVEETMAGELYADGYIATSQIGDFALLHRLKGAVNNLVMGKAASQGLDQWLFDINKARTPQEIKKISTWQNSDINEKQKEAVEKILSVPDVCLIQGPPGTGKTTVIAEAIYQLVIRNKRVLVASQANLAVDNALERLISNPKIRAIRLGSAKKIDSSVSNITEGNVFVVSGILNAFKNLLTYRDELMFGKDTFLCLKINDYFEIYEWKKQKFIRVDKVSEYLSANYRDLKEICNYILHFLHFKEIFGEKDKFIIICNHVNMENIIDRMCMLMQVIDIAQRLIYLQVRYLQEKFLENI